jgi:hypothetical protein
MLQLINNLPAYIVGIRITGEVNMNDYEQVLIHRMEELVKRRGVINYLLVLDTETQNQSTIAWWVDFKIGLKNFIKWNKIAVVTDPESAEWFNNVFRHFISSESKGYKLSELDDAIKWISDNEDYKHEIVAWTRGKIDPARQMGPKPASPGKNV